MIKQTALGLLLACSACAAPPVGSPQVYEVRLDPTLTPDQSELVLHAYDDWHVQTGAQYTTVVSAETCDARPDKLESGCVHVRYGSVEESNNACIPIPGFLHVGCTTTKLVNGHVWAANIILASLGDYTKDYEIALHEAGHSLGLAHDPLNGCLMTAEMENGYPEITQRDIAQFKRVHAN
jgi:hypothetical protein